MMRVKESDGYWNNGAARKGHGGKSSMGAMRASYGNVTIKDPTVYQVNFNLELKNGDLFLEDAIDSSTVNLDNLVKYDGLLVNNMGLEQVVKSLDAQVDCLVASVNGAIYSV
ncbi:hypothetical protein RJT34_16724 [Clitoria ternatea]|uniref:Uncharacterized protein n=1 Tax=Clitoria ternatea TaxID=43366 RepID=A0AAN9J7M0_CLITE